MVQVMEIALVIKSRVFAMVYKARCYSHLHCFLPLSFSSAMLEPLLFLGNSTHALTSPCSCCFSAWNPHPRRSLWLASTLSLLRSLSKGLSWLIKEQIPLFSKTITHSTVLIFLMLLIPSDILCTYLFIVSFPQNLEQCLAHRIHTVNICWMNCLMMLNSLTVLK